MEQEPAKCDICGEVAELTECVLCEKWVCSRCYIASKCICKACKEAGECDLGGRIMGGGY